jgi:hypothetical protein
MSMQPPIFDVNPEFLRPSTSGSEDSRGPEADPPLFRDLGIRMPGAEHGAAIPGDYSSSCQVGKFSVSWVVPKPGLLNLSSM